MSVWLVNASKLLHALDPGAGAAAKIIGKRKDSRSESESYKRVQEIYGEADAKASAIYAKAYDNGRNPRFLPIYQNS